jgi:hypothetical protein
MSMSTGLVVSGGEIALVTGISGNNITVTRGSVGTAAAYSTGQAVTIVRSGSYSQLAANVLRDWYGGLIANPVYGSASAAAMAVSVSSAQQTLQNNAQLPH